MTYDVLQPQASGKYPNHPGSRDNAPETSREAARTVVHVAKSHRAKILKALEGETFGLSSEGIARKAGISKYSVRSRVSELVASGEVIETPFREKNDEGRSVVIWRRAK
jgi:predicted ArsR family transcriptional regulator